MRTQGISKNLRSFLSYPDNMSDEQINRELNERLKRICKPCWELKYCPYGPLVEEFPLPPLTQEENSDHIAYLKKCIERGYMGSDALQVQLTDEKRKLFTDIINTPVDTVNELSRFEKEASCTQFGHMCPAFFVRESFTETKQFRRASRSIPYATIARVIRRDNCICQICGKALRDNEIEIDHIIPHSRGGSAEESNLRVTCLECNRKKSNKLDFLDK